MLLLENSVQNYDWGSFHEIPAFLGDAPSSEPVAELWIGTHRLGPSSVVDSNGVRRLLSDVAGELPFMLKVLSARRPLSLQVHPGLDLAREGFKAENAAGIPVGAPERSFKDPNHKPEMVYALSTFDMMAGFRPTAEILRVLAPIETSLARRLRDRLTTDPGFAGIVQLVEWLVTERPSADEIEALVRACRDLLDQGVDIKRAYATALMVREEFPNDVGVVVALLMNRLTLQPGEAAFLGAGMLHAHLKGLCLEAMANSDNVLRAGLTTKHIDAEALVRCLDAGMSRLARVTPMVTSAGVEVFDPAAGEFALAVAQSSTAYAEGVELFGEGHRLVICSAGEVECVNASEERTKLRRGESLYAGPEDGTLTVHGTGETAQVFLPFQGGRNTLIDLV
ncbi:mannose-6-phosphate isomerase, class I [Aeromicrobium piscarium]|uniref:mannose-6-phosphate isomerase, class I n=1 Tax=Aeromicrobium piscarium TaxID=2590901 RepID=UPI00163D893E|nr:mannose-6-phosphate isomerase, class I [Aeromicrobium piscarium]